LNSEHPFIEVGDGPWLSQIKRSLSAISLADELQARVSGFADSDPAAMSEKCRANFRWQIEVEATEDITLSGKPTVIVANHPHGIVDGYLLAYLCSHRLQTDFRILSNRVAARVATSLSPWMTPIDNQGRKSKARSAYNRERLADLTKFVKAGGCAVFFPAGEVSRWQGSVLRPLFTDSAWFDTALKIALETGAMVLPIHIDGGNSNSFLVIRRVSRFLARLFLFRESLYSEGKSFVITVGQPYFPENGAGLEALTREARKKVYDLAGDSR
jgi:putative hemolysin